jgi:hypothetical protein
VDAGGRTSRVSLSSSASRIINFLRVAVKAVRQKPWPASGLQCARESLKNPRNVSQLAAVAAVLRTLNVCLDCTTYQQQVSSNQGEPPQRESTVVHKLCSQGDRVALYCALSVSSRPGTAVDAGSMKDEGTDGAGTVRAQMNVTVASTALTI